MEDAQAQAQVQDQQLGPCQRGFKIGTLLLMAKKLFSTCSKTPQRITRSRSQAMGAEHQLVSLFVISIEYGTFSIIGDVFIILVMSVFIILACAKAL